MSDLRMRPLGPADAPAAAELIREAFAAQSLATDPSPSALRETAASVAAHLAEGGGAARALIAAGEAEARRRALPRLHLRVRLALEDNRRLFAACGFATIREGAHPGYAEPTFVVMEKALG